VSLWLAIDGSGHAGVAYHLCAAAHIVGKMAAILEEILNVDQYDAGGRSGLVIVVLGSLRVRQRHQHEFVVQFLTKVSAVVDAAGAVSKSTLASEQPHGYSVTSRHGWMHPS